MTHLDAIAVALQKILHPQVGVGVTDPRAPDDDLWTAEKRTLARAIPKRRSEFAAGRRAARAAMSELELPPAAIPVGPQRAPLWPVGMAGSIAHCDTVCIAAISQCHRSIGIDIEPATPLAAELIPIVCTPQEQDWLRSRGPALEGLYAKHIFCAKEAIYKAQYPLTGQVIGFHAVSIRFHEDDTFEATLSPPLPALHGKITVCHGMVLTAALV